MNTSKLYRDMTMDKITESDVSKNLRLAGWVENIRDHGGVSFIDLRDMYGVMQVVMRDTSLLEGISKEECISVEGVIQNRGLQQNVWDLNFPFAQSSPLLIPQNSIS